MEVPEREMELSLQALQDEWQKSAFATLANNAREHEASMNGVSGREVG